MPLAYPARAITLTTAEKRTALAAYGYVAFEGDDNANTVSLMFSFVFEPVTR